MSAVQANALAGSADLIEVTSGLVAAYVAHNSVAPSQVPTLLSQVHAALVGLHRPPAQELAKPIPPVPIKKTVTPDAIISLEDGRPYKSLKRHLSSRGITPDQYRQKWGLPPDYPMVAANYAAQRSELAKSIGLGQSRRAAGQKGK